MSFDAVARLDGRSFSALERRLAKRWTAADELLATLCELVHALIRVQVARGGGRVPPALQVDRPHTPARRQAGGAELVRMLGKSEG